MMCTAGKGKVFCLLALYTAQLIKKTCTGAFEVLLEVTTNFLYTSCRNKKSAKQTNVFPESHVYNLQEN
jgi:hypothetical protein